MDLHQLSLFLAVVETGSISAAARLKNISQPVLSIHVRSLEEYFGVPLLNRHGRGVEPTDAGLLLVEKAGAMMASVQDMKETMEELKGLRRGHLRVGASTTPGVYLLPKTLGQFKADFPGIELDLQIGNTALVKQWVRLSQVALGIIGKKPEDPDFEALPFVKDELVVITSPHYFLKGKKSIRVEQLPEYPFIIREEGSNTRETYDQALRKKGIKLKIVLELGSTEAIKQAVLAGLGISIVSPLSVQWERKHKILHVVQVVGREFARQFHIIYRRDQHLSPATQRFLDRLRA